jgi:hypothetical protein
MQQISSASAIAVLLSGVLAALNCHADSNLHPIEVKWIAAAEPVLDYAAAEGVPIDIIVQPTSTAADVPVAMGVKNGRCTLILSLRDKADAESILQSASPERHALLIETMVAHEMAHCWRYLQGTWHTLPAGFESLADDAHGTSSQQHEMRVTQREEGYADLVALAWVRKKYPHDYVAVHAWLTQVRHDQPTLGGYHDTHVWLQLAADPKTFPTRSSLFEQVQDMWAAGSRDQR